MLIPILNTWTIFILVPAVIPKFSLGRTIEEIRNEPKTMYEAMVRKCPNLEKTDLKNNEIFDKSCLNWAEINATNSFSKDTKNNVECLVYYEALLSFCTDMGDALNIQGVIPSASTLQHNTLDTLCFSNHSLYPIKKAEHNISSLIKNNIDCVLLCSEFTNTGISDICNFAYYFSNFNVTKFIDKLNSIHPIPAIADSLHVDVPIENKPGQLDEHQVNSGKNSLNGTHIGTNDAKQVEGQNGADVQPIKQVQVAGVKKTEVLKPEQTENDDQHHNVFPAKLDIKQDSNSEPKPEQAPVLLDTGVKMAKPPVEQVDRPSNDLPVVPPGKKDDLAENSNIKDLLPDQQAKEENSQPEAVPEKGKKPEINPDNPRRDPEDSIVYGSEDKNVDGPDQEVLEEDEAEAEQEDGDIKPEPAMPEENNKPKETLKKVKPSTVEDEAVSNFNTPEDDMDGDSYFFSYFTVIMCLFIVGYVGYHNRQKILALILEGKKGRRTGRGRRPNSANYHKLDTNLEEAISSSCTKNPSNVIY